MPRITPTAKLRGAACSQGQRIRSGRHGESVTGEGNMIDDHTDLHGPRFEDQGDLLAASQHKMAVEVTLMKCGGFVWGSPSSKKSMLALWLAAWGGRHDR
jgi:hypothetical protein